MKKQLKNIEYVAPGSLEPYKNNAKKHSEDQIQKVMASINEFGFMNPILCDGEKGIIAGHCRVVAAQRIGFEKVPVIEVKHLTEAQKRAYILADNRLAELGMWDFDILNSELDFLEDNDFEIADLGFDPVFFEQENLKESDSEDSGDQGIQFEEIEKKKAAVKRGDGLKDYSLDTHLRIIVLVKDAPLLEKAISATGQQSRGDAILEMCRLYLRIEELKEKEHHNAR